MNLRLMPLHTGTCLSCKHVCGNTPAAANGADAGVVFCGQWEKRGASSFPLRRCSRLCLRSPLSTEKGVFSWRLFPAHAVTNPRERMVTPSWFLVFSLFSMPATVGEERPPSFSTVLRMSCLGRCE